MATHRSEKLDIKNIERQFRHSESSKGKRKGAFKINAPFDEAMKKILKTKPEPKQPKKGKK